MFSKNALNFYFVYFKIFMQMLDRINLIKISKC